jgi:orotate phosphoribosyltransferase
MNNQVRLSNEDIIKLLKETQAVRKGHFQLTSGKHSDTYVQCARLMEQPDTTFHLANETMSRLPKELLDNVDLVASPAIGGMLFGFSVALAAHLPFIFSERKEKEMQLRRSFEVQKNANVLLVEDVVTTGGSVKELANLVSNAGGNICGIVSLIDRHASDEEAGNTFDYPYFPLLRFPTPSWESADCALCAQGIPLDSPGSRNS